MDWNQEDRAELGKVLENAKSEEWIPSMLHDYSHLSEEEYDAMILEELLQAEEETEHGVFITMEESIASMDATMERVLQYHAQKELEEADKAKG